MLCRGLEESDMTSQGGTEAAEVSEAPDIIREVHHQVKNSLQVVCSLLRLEGRGVTDLATHELIRRSEARVQAMALVYDTLYKTGSFLEVPLDRYVRSLTEQVVRGWRGAGQNVVVEYSLEAVSISAKAAVSCGLILNEVLSGIRPNSSATVLRVREQVFHGGIALDLDTDEPSRDRAENDQLSSQIVQALAQQYGGRVLSQFSEYAHYRVELPSIAA